MAQIDYLSKQGLSAVWAAVNKLFVRKEHKTGSDSVYKVLSDNNLTDELVAKINESGVSDFSGAYADLTGKPSIEGHAVVGGNQSAASLGLATPTDVSNATADLISESALQAKGYQTASQVNAIVTGKGYQTAQQVTAAVTAGTAGMATQTWVEGRGYQNSAQVLAAINTAVSSVYTPKGTSAFASLPTPSKALEGDVYNVGDAFTTTAAFVEGAGHKYAAGTNVVIVNDSGTYKWDVLAGTVDLSGYAKTSDIVAITTEEINSICK